MRQGTDKADDLELEPELRDALSSFRQSVDAWSEAVATRPRTVTPTVRLLSWRLVLGTALSCLVVAGSLTVVVARYRNPQTADGQAAPHATVQTAQAAGATAQTAEENLRAEAAARDLVAIEQMLAGQDNLDEQGEGRVTNDEQLLAAVDTDLKRQVPRVMEPLAQLGQESVTE